MKTIFKSSLAVCVLLFMACGSTNKVAVVDEVEKQALDNLVASGNIEMKIQWAMPSLTNSMASIANSGLLAPGNSANRIDLTGSNAYLKVEGDNVSAYLPYYGERQMVTGYGNTDNAIQFDGVPKKFEIKEDAKSQGYQINFDINNDKETYSIFAKVFPGMKSSININGTHRQAISYGGNATAVKSD
ncbi:DUF4251 domain-containing protein [Muricauda sp. 2012CJ35-5]|uniref:DUF4251 domain-containing protein n=1 Tax=Flagellimonas spongiicola TaxID=2942208 RepID=A0ABT0PQ48_9FLAO|nr:DUF4251 domain-containing protein [Allomuricauda spongiicola]MCL6273336.1 DUF4251 domain-containing protein [Allomuricauda spongiicola]